MSGEFQVFQSQKVVEEFRQLLDAARTAGVLPITVRAARWILEELARTPLKFGESREYLPHLGMHLRIGFAGPIFAEFAVNLTDRTVFVRRFGLQTLALTENERPGRSRVLS
jgi:hypothetical protein